MFYGHVHLVVDLLVSIVGEGALWTATRNAKAVIDGAAAVVLVAEPYRLCIELSRNRMSVVDHRSPVGLAVSRHEQIY